MLLSFWKKYLNDSFKPCILNFCHIFFFISAFLCYIPLILGYHLILDIYPDGLTSLSRTSIYGYSLLASAACTIPLLFDNIMSFLTKVYFYSSEHHLESEDKEIIYFKFPTSLLIMIIGTDLFIFTYIISYQQGDILTGLICSRDILFTWSFILNLHKLSSSVWTLSKLSLVMFCSVTLNWIYVWIPMSQVAANSQVLLYVEYFLICLMIISLIFFTTQFFYQVYHENTDHDDISVKLKNIQAGVYAVFLCMYIISAFGPGLFVEIASADWYAYGNSYLAMLTFMMAGCVLCVNVITTGISKIGATIVSKKLLTERKMFMRYISHEIRTPLNTTFLGLNVLKKELMVELKNKNHKCFKTIADTQKSCDIAVRILSDMLLYDKVESGSLMLEFENISPWQFFKTAIEPFYIQAKEAGMKILIEIKTPSYDCTVKMDRHQLSQVVRNVVSNAIKFSEQFSTVKICVDTIQCSIQTSRIQSFKQTSSVRQSLENNESKSIKSSKSYSDYVRFRVTDTGAGISKENQAKLFQGIIQFTPGKLQAGKGTGLGLFISKGIVDKHDGHIWVESAGEGLGSTFTMLLPLQQLVIDVTSAGIVKNFDVESQRQIPAQVSYRDTDPAEMKSQRQKSNKNLEMSQIIFLPSSVYCFDSSAADEEVLSVKDDVSDINKVRDVTDEPAVGQSTNLIIKKNIKNINILVVDDSLACRAMTVKSLLTCSNDDNNEQQYTICCDEASDGNRAVHMVYNNMTSYDSSAIKASFNIADVDDGKTKKLRRGSSSMISKCNNNYDVILMDYQMPEKDGPAAIREIRAMGYTGKIVGLTGNVLSSDINTMRDAGSDDVLTKPVSGSTIETMLSSIYEDICDVENNNNIEDEPLPPSTALIEELFKENMTSKGEETEPASTTFNKKPIIFDMSSRKVLPY